MSKKSILSCLQPTGNLHLGRLFGAVLNWVRLQDDYKCYYGVVDYHAMTMPYKPKRLREQTWSSVFDILACGVKEENMFIQSMVPEHTELTWILACMCSYGDLSRMTQFKDKTQQVRDKDKAAFISSALFTYPVLQAADILIYKADLVPVGSDQDQHLELTRTIANRFNKTVGTEYFVAPETLHSPTPRIMSTADPEIKMSASKGDKHNINVFANPDQIKKQILSAVTDSGQGPRDPMSPGVANLFQLVKATGADAVYQELSARYYDGLMYGELKREVAEVIIEFTEPFRQKRSEINENKREYKQRIKESAAAIRAVAQKTVREVRELSGLSMV